MQINYYDPAAPTRSTRHVRGGRRATAEALTPPTGPRLACGHPTEHDETTL
jgi:hypothetical protein